MAKTVLVQGDPTLPDAGYARNEELARRDDALTELAEAKNDQVEGGTNPIKNVKVDPELAQWFDELDVAGRDPGYEYCWTPTHTYGRFVQQKLYKGWEMVQGDMPEARALRSTDTTRKLGDVVLMRIQKDRKALLDRREEYKKLQQEVGISAQLQEMADKYGTRLIDGDDINPEQLRRMEMNSRAKGRANKMMDKWMREGRVPGVMTS